MARPPRPRLLASVAATGALLAALGPHAAATGPTAPPPRDYGPADEAPPPAGSPARKLLAAAGAAFAAAFPGRPRPRPDARLSAVAAVLAEVAADDPAWADRSSARLAFELWRHGVATPAVTPLGLRFAGPTPPGADAIAPLLRALAEAGATTHLGVAVRASPRSGAGATSGGVAVVLLARARAVLEAPFPSLAGPGTAVPLRIALRPGLGAPRLVLGPPRGPVVTRALDPAAGGRFRTDVDFLLGPGEYRVEVVADGDGGPEVVLLFPVWVGVAPPALPTERLPLTGAADASGFAPADALERAALSLVNADRRAAGLPPVVSDARLADAARAHAMEMRAAGAIAHFSAATGDPADRVAARGLTFARVTENVGVAPTVKAAHDAFLASPAHRANILDPAVDAVGIGVAPEPGGPGASSGLGGRVFVTYVFAARLGAAGAAPLADEAVVWKALQAARAGAGLPALTADAAATAAARDQARAMLAHGKAAARVGGVAFADLLRLHGATRHGTAAALRVLAGDVAGLGPAWGDVRSPRFVRAGVGVAHAPAAGASVYVAVALLGPAE
jgi:uncharacterized protein YkwD